MMCIFNVELRGAVVSVVSYCHFPITSLRVKSFFENYIESCWKLTTTHHKNAFLRRVVSCFSVIPFDVKISFNPPHGGALYGN